jgi:uncharacterized protein YjbI with pentapeptide repeats
MAALSCGHSPASRHNLFGKCSGPANFGHLETATGYEKARIMSENKQFEHQRMDEAEFRDISMARAVFDDVNLSGAVFANVSLAGAKFSDVNMKGVVIEDANIEGLTIFGHDILALIKAELARKKLG